MSIAKRRERTINPINADLMAGLDFEGVLREFRAEEESPSRLRRGTFKIAAPFDKALDTILKSKPPRLKKKPA